MSVRPQASETSAPFRRSCSSASPKMEIEPPEMMFIETDPRLSRWEQESPFLREREREAARQRQQQEQLRYERDQALGVAEEMAWFRSIPEFEPLAEQAVELYQRLRNESSLFNFLDIAPIPEEELMRRERAAARGLPLPPSSAPASFYRWDKNMAADAVRIRGSSLGPGVLRKVWAIPMIGQYLCGAIVAHPTPTSLDSAVFLLYDSRTGEPVLGHAPGAHGGWDRPGMASVLGSILQSVQVAPDRLFKLRWDGAFAVQVFERHRMIVIAHHTNIDRATPNVVVSGIRYGDEPDWRARTLRVIWRRAVMTEVTTPGVYMAHSHDNEVAIVCRADPTLIHYYRVEDNNELDDYDSEEDDDGRTTGEEYIFAGHVESLDQRPDITIHDLFLGDNGSLNGHYVKSATLAEQAQGRRISAHMIWSADSDEPVRMLLNPLSPHFRVVSEPMGLWLYNVARPETEDQGFLVFRPNDRSKRELVFEIPADSVSGVQEMAYVEGTNRLVVFQFDGRIHSISLDQLHGTGFGPGQIMRADPRGRRAIRGLIESQRLAAPGTSLAMQPNEMLFEISRYL